MKKKENHLLSDPSLPLAGLAGGALQLRSAIGSNCARDVPSAIMYPKALDQRKPSLRLVALAANNHSVLLPCTGLCNEVPPQDFASAIDFAPSMSRTSWNSFLHTSTARFPVLHPAPSPCYAPHLPRLCFARSGVPCGLTGSPIRAVPALLLLGPQHIPPQWKVQLALRLEDSQSVSKFTPLLCACPRRLPPSTNQNHLPDH